MKRVHFKDGSYVDTDVSWEYENDPNWLKTVNICDRCKGKGELPNPEYNVDRPALCFPPAMMDCPSCKKATP